MALQTNGSGKFISALLAICTLLIGFILGDGLASSAVERRLNERMDRELAHIQKQLDIILIEVQR